MSPQEPEGDAQGSPFPPPFKWGATRPAPKPAQQRPEGPRPEPPVVLAQPPVSPRPLSPTPTPPAISTQPAAPSADTELGAPPVSPPWLAPEPVAGHGQQSAPGRQSVAFAVLIGVLVLVVAGVVAFVVL
ncbi:hypothetical protein [Rhodococcus sp. MTM3W5.2]|uniref:hypothetical protein n=1 Tax=Rhodococcus sp. MTM3W5.2 TaxID=1805827 RepID=UPI00097BD510|nr:hypothetical protein [Rhodococcus sp. MTM3W5.2]